MASGYLRYPHVHGDQVVFVADDDLWLTRTSGGRACRATAERTPVRSPRFSPDGTKVAYVLGEPGNQDLWVLDLEGGRRRLTWLSAHRMLVSGWLDHEHVLVASMHNESLRALSWMYSVSLDCDLERQPWGPAMSASVHADGRVAVVSPNFRGPEHWKHYRGGMANRAWISDSTSTGWSRLLGNETASLVGVTWWRNRLIFTSDMRSTQAQVWSVKPDGSDLRDHTRHTFEQGYCRDATTDGTRVVYHARGRLYVMDSLDAKPRPIDVRLVGGGPEPEPVDGLDHIESIAPDHGGDGSLLSWRGQAWFLTHRSGPARALSDLPGVRVREAIPLGKSGKGIWATDAEGEDCLEIVQLDGDGDPRRIAGGKVGRILSLAASVDGTRVAVVSHDGTIHAINVASGALKKVGTSPGGEATGLAFSPDGRYLVWREAFGPEGISGRIVGYDFTDDRSFVVTRGRFKDFSPAFSLDGKYLWFLSSRNIDPSYDELGFDLGFTNTVRPYVIPLRAEDPAPFGPSADGWAISEDEEGDKKGGEHDSEEEAKPDAIVFEIEGAEDRMVPLPVAAGRYEALFPTAHGVAWRKAHSYAGVLGTGRLPGVDPKESVEGYDLAHRKSHVLVEACDDVAISGDGKQLVVRNGDELWLQPSDARPDDDEARINIDLSRLRRTHRPSDEWRQMFDENARLMRDHFWREDMNGVDWAGVCAAYRPLVEQLATRDDMVDLLDEVVAELGTSHAYVIPPPMGSESKVAWLGAEFKRNAKGEVVISRILDGESSDPSARSPLRAAGVAAKPGDVILAVDGRLTSEVPDIGALLIGAAGKTVELTLVRGRMKRRVAVVPVDSEGPLRYHEWVASRAARVDRISRGRLGYLHVPNMAAQGWAEFHRLIEEACRKDGVVVDVRYNGGGHTSALIIERLSRRVVAWEFGRHYAEPWAYPFQGMRGPVVFVTNPYAGSDGDIVTAAAQNLGLGPVVGERSWGGVVGIDGRFELVDGTTVTQPRYAFAFKKQGFAVENHGTEPDISVPLNPADWESGEDKQLDVAIAEALSRLARQPAEVPPQLPPPAR